MAAMTQSARAVMKGSRLILVSPNPPPEISRLFDVVHKIDIPATWERLCVHKANVISAWQRSTENDTIFVDPDVEFKREPEFGDDCDVAVSWRTTRADQPVNLGLLYARPNCHLFWKNYGVIAAYIPPQLHSWWCDQLAMSILLGVDHEEWQPFRVYNARVKAIPFSLMCSPPEKARADAWTIHLKGRRKGEAWDRYYAKNAGGHSSNLVSAAGM